MHPRLEKVEVERLEMNADMLVRQNLTDRLPQDIESVMHYLYDAKIVLDNASATKPDEVRTDDLNLNNIGLQRLITVMQLLNDAGYKGRWNGEQDFVMASINVLEALGFADDIDDKVESELKHMVYMTEKPEETWETCHQIDECSSGEYTMMNCWNDTHPDAELCGKCICMSCPHADCPPAELYKEPRKHVY